ncbi:redoxin domain-containing protein [Methylibium sp. T29]|uniref:redoxin domain-containing protein n=1 Tax=Methylibium sp. T29 TaxID=1430884 RepID=UPI0003F471A7|nr:thiol-disulfide oxidoreductase [Methylibium sp. T29]
MRALSNNRRRFTLSAAAVIALPTALTALPGAALAVSIGEAAPDFELKDTHGKTVKLADFKGRHVVLEWTNPGCPFVQKHYSSQNMQSLQKEFVGRNVAWLSISSTARGATDYLEPGALQAKYQGWGAAPTALLMDDAGSVGKAYGAKTTPHMYVIDRAASSSMRAVSTTSAPPTRPT